MYHIYNHNVSDNLDINDIKYKILVVLLLSKINIKIDKEIIIF